MLEMEGKDTLFTCIVSPAFWGFWRMLLPEHILLHDGSHSEASQRSLGYPASGDEFKHSTIHVHAFTKLGGVECDAVFIIPHLKNFR